MWLVAILLPTQVTPSYDMGSSCGSMYALLIVCPPTFPISGLLLPDSTSPSPGLMATTWEVTTPALC